MHTKIEEKDNKLYCQFLIHFLPKTLILNIFKAFMMLHQFFLFFLGTILVTISWKKLEELTFMIFLSMILVLLAWH